MSLISLLESVIGRSKKTSGNNVSFKCPLCNHYKHKLEIDLITKDSKIFMNNKENKIKIISQN